MAKSRNTLAEKYAGDVSGALKFEAKRKEDARLKVFFFSSDFVKKKGNKPPPPPVLNPGSLSQHNAFAALLLKNYDSQKSETEGVSCLPRL